MSIENFRTGNPNIHFSGYPGSEFPHQCGGGYGYGGYGQYGTYGSCATYDHYNADKVDFGGDGVSCGTPPMKPVVSVCNATLPMKPATKCGPCGGAEGFTGAGDDSSLGCAKPVWWGDNGCQMPPKHCGAGSCGYYGADGGYKTHGQAGFEEFDGAMAAYSSYDDADVAGGCTAAFEAQHKPGCNCVKCMMPYSAPYHVGPGCGRPVCRCKQCDGDCKCGAKVVENKMLGLAAAKAQSERRLTPRSLVIALVVAYLAYRLFQK